MSAFGNASIGIKTVLFLYEQAAITGFCFKTLQQYRRDVASSFCFAIFQLQLISEALVGNALNHPEFRLRSSFMIA